METKQKLNDMLSKAIALAASAHNGQFDRGGNPYILHPIAVMNILNSNDIELNICCIIHDIVEDTKVTFQDLYDAGMTERIVDGIRRMTKMPGQTYEEYQQGIFESRDAMLVKAADLTHNSDFKRLKGVSDKDIARLAKYSRFYFEIQQRLNAS